jgi:hypothetical protein
MKRERGIELVTMFDDAKDETYIKNYCDYLGISVKEFWDKVHSSVNKDLFEILETGQIIRKYKVGIGL